MEDKKKSQKVTSDSDEATIQPPVQQLMAVKPTTEASPGTNIVLVLGVAILTATICSILSVGAFWFVNQDKFVSSTPKKSTQDERPQKMTDSSDEPTNSQVSDEPEKDLKPELIKPQLGKITDITETSGEVSIKFTSLEWGEGDEYVDGNWFDESDSEKMTLKVSPDIKIYRFPDMKDDCSLYSDDPMSDPYSYKIEVDIQELQKILDCYKGQMIFEAMFQNDEVFLLSQVFIP